MFAVGRRFAVVIALSGAALPVSIMAQGAPHAPAQAPQGWFGVIEIGLGAVLRSSIDIRS